MESLRLNEKSSMDDPITHSILYLDLLRRNGQYNEATTRAHDLSKDGLPPDAFSITMPAFGVWLRICQVVDTKSWLVQLQANSLAIELCYTTRKLRARV